jgi:hypothetical protein
MDFEEDDKRKSRKNVPLDPYLGAPMAMPNFQMPSNPNLMPQVMYGGAGVTNQQPSNRMFVEGVSGRDFFGRMSYNAGISWATGNIRLLAE